jgi:hypothetical protein
MGKSERKAYLKVIRSRYCRAGKKIKVTILDEFCAVCGYVPPVFASDIFPTSVLHCCAQSCKLGNERRL